MPKRIGKDTGAREKAYAIRLRGIGHRLETNYSAAIEIYQEALNLFRTLARKRRCGDGVETTSRELNGFKDYDAAERDYREALRIAKKINYREGVVYITGNLAALALNREVDRVRSLGARSVGVGGEGWAARRNC